MTKVSKLNLNLIWGHLVLQCSSIVRGDSRQQRCTVGNKKKRRKRTIFTCEQLNRLESEFADQQYMVGAERQQLAEALNLSETQVKFWLYYLFHFLKCQEN